MIATKRTVLVVLLVAAMALAVLPVQARPQGESLGTAFTFQGQLKSDGTPITGDCYMEFRLYADAAGTSQVGPTVSSTIPIADGFFTAQLNFGGDAFDGSARWLDIKVQCTGDPSMVNLGLQALTPTPHALALPGLYTQQQADPLVGPNLIGGYSGNWVGDGIWGATIGGGGEDWARNRVLGNLGTIAGGTDNQAGSDVGTILDSELATVGGGASNRALGAYSTVGGGTNNSAENSGATIGGGGGNLASGVSATIAGGGDNVASGEYNATVGGGYGNMAGGTDATVSGGNSNTASDWAATVGGGHTNSATGPGSTVPGGEQNSAAGAYSFAAGLRAKANHAGAFVWADNIDQDLASTADDQFLVRATGGVNFVTGEAPFQVNGANPWAGSQYANVVVVAKSGGDFTSIQAALDGIDDASAANPYLVWVAPGVYTETVTMKSYVDIEGAGETTTKITSDVGSSSSSATVTGANNSELRFLTVENYGDYTFCIAILNSGTSPRLTHVTAVALGGVNTTTIRNDSSAEPLIRDVTATAASTHGSNSAIANYSSSPSLFDVTAQAFGTESGATAVVNYQSPSVMTNVKAIATGAGSSNWGVLNDQSSPVTMTNVDASAEGASSYNIAIGNQQSSVNMLNVHASASGTGINEAVRSSGAPSIAITMTNSVAFAYGGSENYGLNCVGDGDYSVKLMTVKASASGPATSTNYGIKTSNGFFSIENSSISATGGIENYGIHINAYSGAYTMTVDNSQIKGSTNAIMNDLAENNITTYVGASQLHGGPFAGSGTEVCAGVYDEDYTFYPDTCP